MTAISATVERTKVDNIENFSWSKGLALHDFRCIEPVGVVRLYGVQDDRAEIEEVILSLSEPFFMGASVSIVSGGLDLTAFSVTPLDGRKLVKLTFLGDMEIAISCSGGTFTRTSRRIERSAL